jgi:hypothetical protein
MGFEIIKAYFNINFKAEKKKHGLEMKRPFGEYEHIYGRL